MSLLDKLGFKLVSKSDWDSVSNSVSVESVRKSNFLASVKDSVRPVAGFGDVFGSGVGVVPSWAGVGGLKYREMVDLACLSSVYAQAVNSLQWELFRRSGEFVKKFECKCVNPDCGKEFDFVVDSCDECGSGVRFPSFSELNKVKGFFDKCNERQSVLDVCQEVEWDLDVVDNGFFVLNWDYEFNSDGEIIFESSKPFELVRANPSVMRLILDKELRIGFDWDGSRVFACPVHRSKSFGDEGFCPECGLRLLNAWYVADNDSNSGDSKVFYFENEVLHVSKYKPSLGYGYPPFLSVYQKVLIELNQDWYISKSYDKGRPPNSWMFVKTSNIPSFQKMIEWVTERVASQPHAVTPIGIDTNASGDFVKHVDLLKSNQEMQATEFRNVIKREIGARLGVMPLFQGDLSSSGGLNNEGLQVTVTNRAIESGQRVFNEKVFPFLLKNFGVVDWVFELLPSEEKDEMSELQRDALRIQNARNMLSMGFNVDLDVDGDFVFSGEASVSALSSGFDSGFDFGKPFGFDGSPESVGKAKPKVRGFGNEVAGDLEEAIRVLVDDLKFKRVGSEEDVRKRVRELVAKFGDRAEKILDSELKSVYLSVVDDVGKSLNRNILFSDVDENALSVLRDSSVLSSAYSKVEDGLVSGLNNVIKNAFESPSGLSIDEMVKGMKSVVGDSEAGLRRIARTESSKVANLARELSYSKVDDKGLFLYKWVGPRDSRTSDVCSELEDLTKSGVSLVELKGLIKRVSKKFGVEPVSDLVPHVNCRHSFFKVV